MGQVLCIKNRRLGQGMPLVCVPIMASKRTEIIEEARRLVQMGTDMIEWRVDAFEAPTDMNAIRAVLEELSDIVKETILLYTFRSKAQGGSIQLSAEEIYDIHQIAAESHVVDLIDVEYFAEKHPKKEIRLLQKMGARVIASHHDFTETPNPEVMRMLLEQMNSSGADIVKLAVMPHGEEDVLALLFETSLFCSKHPDTPIITMSMGALGCISRIAGETFGSCVTFGAGKKASAPGQLPMDDLKRVLAIIHSSQSEEDS